MHRTASSSVAPNVRRPRISVPGYAGLPVTIPTPEVGDDEIDRQIDRLRNNFAELNEVDRPADPLFGTHEVGDGIEGTGDWQAAQLPRASVAMRLRLIWRGARGACNGYQRVPHGESLSSLPEGGCWPDLDVEQISS